MKHKLDDDVDATVFELVEVERFNVYMVRAFESIDKDEEKEGSDALVEDENMHTSIAIKKFETVKPTEATSTYTCKKITK